MRYYIIVGEASGDLHGSKLATELLAQDSDAQIEGWGGDKMKEAGVNVLQHYRDIAYMGFVEVVRHLPKIIRHFKICKKQISAFNPDVIILVDYPGFNLRIAKWANTSSYKVCYYIAPQLWAWNPNRAHIINKYVDRLFVILPFEVDFFDKYNIKAQYVGHPLLESISAVKNNKKDNVIALLPGSRSQEIKSVLPVMLSIVRSFPDYQFVIAGISSIKKELYEALLPPFNKNLSLKFNNTYEILKIAKAAIVTSGTATLETALYNVPQVVVYKGSNSSFFIAKRLVNVPFISLVNLILDKKIVHELIQNELTKENLLYEIKYLLNRNNQLLIKSQYAKLRDILGSQPTSKVTAKRIIELANDK